ncbi:hypothetical protein [Nocardioides sp. Root190]|uniref:hypothetical protein n=1 Tax=Nocardioides sp. Root190 TaxID=1736488 RepID=UPI0012F8B7CF|nr:hypothetical protein [Nocardioides sp. Root190]
MADSEALAGATTWIPETPTTKRRFPIWVMVVSGIGLSAVVLLVVAVATADRWTAVDAPAQPAVYSTAEHETGEYEVLDDLTPPCSIGQDWNACVKVYVKSHAAACQGVKLAAEAQDYCDGYGKMIDEMRNADSGPDDYVSSLGYYGLLTKYALLDVTRTLTVEPKPARTHEAVCYLGFVGECDKDAEVTGTIAAEASAALATVYANNENYCSKITGRECVRLMKQEYSKACDVVDRSAMTQAAWTLCNGQAHDIRLTPATKDRAAGEAVFGKLTLIQLTTTKEEQVTVSKLHKNDTPSKLETELRNEINRPANVRSRAQIKQELLFGAEEDDLIADVDGALENETISQTQHCLYFGFIRNVSDSEIIEGCAEILSDLN